MSSGAVIALPGGLYVSRVPEFPRSFVADPVGAVRGDPVAVAFVFGIVLATVLLVALIVGFGARYGMAGDE